MTNTEKATRTPQAVSYGMRNEQAAILARLADRYAEAVPAICARTPEASVSGLLHAVTAHQVRRLFTSDARWRRTTGITAVPEDRTEDVAAAMGLLQVARADLEGLEAALLLAARSNSSRTGKPLLTFEQIADALGVESEQAAQCRYRRMVGMLDATSSGADGTP